jgi:protein O-GlcNAc transferase
MASLMEDVHRLVRAGQPIRALAMINAALSRAPDEPGLYAERIRLLVRSGDSRQARATFEQAIARIPDHAGLLAMGAVLDADLGRIDAAIDGARRALVVDPAEPVAAALLTRLLTERCEPTAAVDVARALLEQRPESPQVWRSLSSALLFRGDAPAARDAASRAVAGLRGDPAAIGTALTASLYDGTLSPGARADQHRHLGATIVPARCDVPLAPAGAARLRVGFYSADFRHHPVGHLVRPVLEQLDRERFQPFCYAHMEQRDGLTADLATLPGTWREVTMLSDEDLLAQMRADRLDVLVDLAGHSHGGRPRVLRGRAAPVQLSWLGYLNTSGLPEMDGLIGDAVVLPDGCEPLYGETLRRLPLGLFCLQSPGELPPVAPLPMTARGHPTLGSFNHLAKLSDATVALWSRVLLARADARLVLCAIPLLEQRTRKHTLERFVGHGIAPERIELRRPLDGRSEFLRQYDDIDLALDPLPFSGGATTLDALRQGVPVVTRPGDGMHNRMSASVLSRIGLDDFVAHTDHDYETIALDWLGRPDRLAAIRAQLRSRLAASPAGDSDRYTRAVERLLLDAAGR